MARKKQSKAKATEIDNDENKMDLAEETSKLHIDQNDDPQETEENLTHEPKPAVNMVRNSFRKLRTCLLNLFLAVNSFNEIAPRPQTPLENAEPKYEKRR